MQSGNKKLPRECPPNPWPSNRALPAAVGDLPDTGRGARIPSPRRGERARERGPSLNLTGIAWRGYALPFRERYVTSGGQATSKHGLLVFLRTSDGLLGTGEASPVGPGSADEVANLATALRRLAPRLLASDPEEAETNLDKWDDIPPEVRFGLETAGLDLRGQAAGRSFSELLGGSPTSLTVNALIAAESPGQAVAEALEAVGLGFWSLKLKVGHADLSRDEALVSAVRRTVGAEVKLRLDPNQAWDVDRAIEALRTLSRYGIEYVEQPVPAADIAGLAAVRRAVTVPIAADESLGSLRDLHRLLEADAAEFFVLKAARLGGLKASLEVASAALEAGKQVVITTSLESSVGVAASAHLASSIPSGGPAHGLATGLLLADDLASPRLLPQRGGLATPSSPGLGVKVDPALLRKCDIGVMGCAGSPAGLEEYLEPPGLQ